ncbi:UNVERIFIED_CONTAM: hypothetical protein FKN15_021170 [Acipenser sinensis]
MDPNQSVKCKIVVVGDSQCGKTALLHVFAKDCFPEWKGEIQEFCPNTKMLLVGCKSDLRTALSTLVELSNHRQTPVSYDQGSNMAKQIGAPYIECSSLQSENSVRDIFHVATLACVNKMNKNVKRNKSTRATKRISHMPSRPDLSAVTSELRKDKAKSCTVM